MCFANQCEHNRRCPLHYFQTTCITSWLSTVSLYCHRTCLPAGTEFQLGVGNTAIKIQSHYILLHETKLLMLLPLHTSNPRTALDWMTCTINPYYPCYKCYLIPKNSVWLTPEFQARELHLLNILCIPGIHMQNVGMSTINWHILCSEQHIKWDQPHWMFFQS